MGTGNPAPDLDALLSDSFTAERGGQTCWGARLEGSAAEYIARIREAVEQGQTPVWRKVAMNLGEHFGIAISYGPVKAHVLRECRCPR